MSKTVATVAAPSGTINIREGFTSITGDDLGTKKRVFNALATAAKLDDNLGKSIFLVDVLVQPRDSEPDEKTGEIDSYLSITMLDADGTAYNAGSKGLANSMENLLAVYGHPSTWAEPLEVQASGRRNDKGTYFVLEVM